MTQTSTIVLEYQNFEITLLVHPPHELIGKSICIWISWYRVQTNESLITLCFYGKALLNKQLWVRNKLLVYFLQIGGKQISSFDIKCQGPYSLKYNVHVLQQQLFLGNQKGCSQSLSLIFKQWPSDGVLEPLAVLFIPPSSFYILQITLQHFPSVCGHLPFQMGTTLPKNIQFICGRLHFVSFYVAFIDVFNCVYIVLFDECLDKFYAQ